MLLTGQEKSKLDTLQKVFNLIKSYSKPIVGEGERFAVTHADAKNTTKNLIGIYTTERAAIYIASIYRRYEGLPDPPTITRTNHGCHPVTSGGVELFVNKLEKELSILVAKSKQVEVENKHGKENNSSRGSSGKRKEHPNSGVPRTTRY
ncbi:hypothetical protein KAR91_42905 [Candidatus Pacearchaeota archaeon]|nr:hypothetical protein [Candidatus Pacearchaeota archaeon]